MEILNKEDIDQKSVKILSGIYDKPTGNIIYNSARLKPVSLRSEIRQGCPLLSLPFNIVLEVLARAIGQK